MGTLKLVLALMLATLLAACGGGGDGVQLTATASTPAGTALAIEPVTQSELVQRPQGNGCNNTALQDPAGARVSVVFSGVSWGVDSTATYSTTVDSTLTFPALDPDGWFSLAMGESVTTGSGSVVTYAAREFVTVPAGTFLACKFVETHAMVDGFHYPNGPDTFTHWLMVDYGITVKFASKVFVRRDEAEAVSVTVNGRRL